MHWLTEAILTAHENGSNYMEATHSILFQFHGAVNTVLNQEEDVCGEAMTQERKMQEIYELNVGLNEALEVYRNVKGY